MTAEIIPIRERLVWICTHCDAQSFYLYNDSTVECTVCGKVSEGGEWRVELPEDPEETPKDNGGCYIRHIIGSEDLAWKRTEKRIQDWKKNDHLAYVVAFSENDGATSWGGITTFEQRDWLIRQLRLLADNTEKDCNYNEPKSTQTHSSSDAPDEPSA